MAKIIALLLLLIQWSNVYAWSCYYDNGSDGWYEEGTMVCTGIEVSVAIEDHYCEWHRPEDPYCDQFQEPTCVDLIEYKTESCGTNYTGVKNYSRKYSCQTLSWDSWVISSDLCSPLPPTCIESVESMVVQCDQGFEGSITRERISSCPDPYGTSVWSDWLESQNNCTQSTTDPVSPISVTSPTNPVSVMPTEPATAPVIDVPQTSSQPTVESVIQEELSDSTEKVETDTSDEANTSKEVKQDKQDRDKKESKDNVDEVVDDSKEIVHGFGLVLSLETLNKPMEFYQPPLTDMFSITQELPIDADTREFQLNLLQQDHIQDYYDTFSNYTWERLRSGSIY